MKDKKLGQAMNIISNTRECSNCPINTSICRLTSEKLFGKERCLLAVAMNEILAFHTDEAKKSREDFKKGKANVKN